MTRPTFTAEPARPDLYAAQVEGSDIEGLADIVTVRVGHAFTDVWVTVEDRIGQTSTSACLSADAARTLAEVLQIAAATAEARKDGGT
jgi:hypothetical protein